MILFSFTVYIIFVINFSDCLHKANQADITRLRATILQGYDNFTRPVQNHKDTLEVELAFFYSGFEFDEQRGMITLHLLTSMHWQDDHVSWDPLDYGNLSEVTFAPTELWRPDISVINNYDESEIDHFASTYIVAQSTSWLWWIPPTKFQVGCNTDFRLWPYDRHSCSIYVSSWSHQGSEVDITSGGNQTELDMDFSNGTENREWKIAKSTVKRRFHIIQKCCPEVSFVNMMISLDIERRSAAHTAAVSVVGLGIAVAILVSFWLDPFANERIPLTLLLILLNSLYLQFMHHVIPNNGGNVPLMICFFRDSLIMVMFALAWTVLIRYVAKARRNSPVTLPAFVETLLGSFVATILCLNPRPQSKGQSQRKQAESAAEEDGDVSELVQEDTSNYQEDWEWLARLLDRIAFLAYFIAYAIFISAFLY